MPRLGLVAKARGDIGHSPDGGIVKAALEPDCAEGSEAVCDCRFLGRRACLWSLLYYTDKWRFI